MRRTDLAFESARECKESLDGVKISVEEREFFKVERVEITNENSAKKLSKPCGNYVTVALSSLNLSLNAEREAIKAISKEIERLLPNSSAPYLIAGLGNNEITADSLGPKTANQILATRHIGKEFKEAFKLPSLRSVVSVSTGVLGKTGMETEEIIKGISSQLKPCCIIVVDAFAAADKGRICTSVQISNSGINPGSGVGNSRKEISENTLGVPVIAVGVPTVTDQGDDLVLTHRDIDLCVNKAALLLSNSINLSLQPSLDLETIQGLI